MYTAVGTLEKLTRPSSQTCLLTWKKVSDVSSFFFVLPSFRDGDIGSGEMEVSRPINRWQIREGGKKERKEKSQSRRPSQGRHVLYSPHLGFFICDPYFLTGSWQFHTHLATNLPGCVCHERPPMNIFLKERRKRGRVRVTKISDKNIC